MEGSIRSAALVAMIGLAACSGGASSDGFAQGVAPPESCPSYESMVVAEEEEIPITRVGSYRWESPTIRFAEPVEDDGGYLGYHFAGGQVRLVDRDVRREPIGDGFKYVFTFEIASFTGSPRMVIDRVEGTANSDYAPDNPDRRSC